MSDKRTKNAQFHLGLHPDLLARARAAAAADGRTVTNWIERVLTEALKAANSGLFYSHHLPTEIM